MQAAMKCEILLLAFTPIYIEVQAFNGDKDMTMTPEYMERQYFNGPGRDPSCRSYKDAARNLCLIRQEVGSQQPAFAATPGEQQ